MSQIKSVTSAVDLNGGNREIRDLNDVQLTGEMESISINKSRIDDPMVKYERNLTSLMEASRRKQKPDGEKTL